MSLHRLGGSPRSAPVGFTAQHPKLSNDPEVEAARGCLPVKGAGHIGTDGDAAH
jgi:hypothetical protein